MHCGNEYGNDGVTMLRRNHGVYSLGTKVNKGFIKKIGKVVLGIYV